MRECQTMFGQFENTIHDERIPDSEFKKRLRSVEIHFGFLLVLAM